MGNSKGLSIGKLILQLAIGVMLLVAGIWVFANTDKGGDEAVKAIRKIFDNKDLGKTVGIVFGAIEFVCGAFLVLEPFVAALSKYTSIASLAVVVIWVIAIVLIDFCGTGSGGPEWSDAREEPLCDTSLRQPRSQHGEIRGLP